MNLSRAVMMLTVALVAAANARAQAPEAVAIVVLGARSYVFAGASLQARATAYDEWGGTVSAEGLEWKTANPGIAAVNAAGLVTGLTCGITTITVTDPVSGMSDSASIRVYPARISIVPSVAVMEAGSTKRFSASAWDAKGVELTELRWKWTSSVHAVAGVSEDGVVTAGQAGRVTVGVAIDAGTDYNIGTQLQLTIKRRPNYRIMQIAGGDPVAASTRGITGVSHSSNDKYSVIVNLSTGGMALRVYDRGVGKTILSSGQYLSSGNRLVGRILSTSINASGDVAAYITSPAHYCDSAIVLYRGGNISVVDTACSFSLRDRALNDRGDLTWSKYGDLMLLPANGGLARKILGGGDTIQGFGKVTWVDGPTAASNGDILVSARTADASGCFTYNGKTFQKLVSTADRIQGQLINWLDLPFEGAAGEYYFRTGAYSASVLKASAGTLEVWARVGEGLGTIPRLNWIDRILDAGAGGLVVSVQVNQGSAIATITPGTAGISIPAASPQQVTTAFLTQQKTLAGLGPDAGGFIVLQEYSGTERKPLVTPGALLETPAAPAVAWDAMFKGFDAGNLMVRGAGESILRAAGQSLQAVVTTGSLLAGKSIGNMWASTAAPDGSAAFYGTRGGNPALYFIRNQTVSVLAEADGKYTLPDGTRFYDFPAWTHLSMNRNGQVVGYGWTDKGSRLALFREGSSSATLVYAPGTLIGAGQMTDVWKSAIDDQGRVLFYGPSAAGRMLAINDGRTVTKVLQTGDSVVPGGPKVTDFSNVIAAGKRFFVMAQFQNGSQWLSYDGTAWRSIISSGTVLSFGATINYFPNSDASVNLAGDLAFLGVDTAGYMFAAVRKAGGGDVIVAMSSEQAQEGDWFTGIYNVSISDAGTVNFVASAWRGGKPQYGLYQAIPQ